MTTVRKAHYPRKPDDKLPLFEGSYYEHHTTQAFDWRGPRWAASLRCVCDRWNNSHPSFYVAAFSGTDLLARRMPSTALVRRPQYAARIAPRTTTGVTYMTLRTVRKG